MYVLLELRVCQMHFRYTQIIFLANYASSLFRIANHVSNKLVHFIVNKAVDNPIWSSI